MAGKRLQHRFEQLPALAHRCYLDALARRMGARKLIAETGEALSLPVHPSLSDDDLDRIVTAVNTVAKAGA